MNQQDSNEDELQLDLAALYHSKALIVAVVPSEFMNFFFKNVVTKYRIYYVPADQR